MKLRYRLFLRRKSVFYAFDDQTRKYESLKTRDRREAQRLVAAMNEASLHAAMSRRLAHVYFQYGDPVFADRTWQRVMEEAAKNKSGPTRLRWESAMREKPFDSIRDLKLIDTRAEHFLSLFNTGTVSTNIYLRRLHNFALDMNWLPAPIIVRRQWPKIEFREKRGVTLEEHQRILANEENAEWRAFYSLLWHLGGSQSDVASLRAEDVDWTTRVVSFYRMKTYTAVQLHFGDELAELFKSLPGQGRLLPNIARMVESDRAKAFMRRCRLARVSGVTLHSYRYSWAERAKAAGYPERFAQEALGHKSKAIHRAYARHAQMKLPSLEEYEKKIVPLQAAPACAAG